jgi:hypothetical protein
MFDFWIVQSVVYCLTRFKKCRRASFLFLLTVCPSPNGISGGLEGSEEKVVTDQKRLLSIPTTLSLTDWLPLRTSFTLSYWPCRERESSLIYTCDTHKLCWLCSSSVCFGCCCTERVPKSSESTHNFHIRIRTLTVCFLSLSLSLYFDTARYIQSTQDVGMLRKSL